MSFIPYLKFYGTCEAAMTFYADLFGATEVQILRYSDAPKSEGLPTSDAVMYSHIMVGEHTCLMASDLPPGSEPAPQQSVSVNHPVATIEEGKRIFEQLSAGGTITMPYAQTFFAPAFGMVQDRFGTHWMIGVEPPST
ncbi:VOC family protein [Shimia abyssi]|uniref:PhnB protein n=1 Tax=Shimia abyssi TaxID=1662395 RepID=A0A2P8FDF7_9RHOB|nr:VOC family protein [Shimia abyssi]PSL19747.1 PhnB protein [Shimia abyssi]